MIDFIFAIIAIAATANPPENTAKVTTSIQDDPAYAHLVAEPQTPTGKFTTATEVKPILTATKANWVALRAYGGNDLVYVTHLWAWRCGLSAVAISVNDGPLRDWPLPACNTEFATPNAVLEADGLPYQAFAQGSIARITVQIIYDDLTRDMATYEADQIRIP